MKVAAKIESRMLDKITVGNTQSLFTKVRTCATMNIYRIAEIFAKEMEHSGEHIQMDYKRKMIKQTL